MIILLLKPYYLNTLFCFYEKCALCFSVLLNIPLDVSGCSAQRKKIFEQAYTFLAEVHNLQCEKSYLDMPKSCDINKIEQCLENFGSFLNFASASESACGYGIFIIFHSIFTSYITKTCLCNVYPLQPHF